MSSRPPRVLQVVLSLNPGGTERLVLELTKRLHEQVPMAVCCLDEEGTWAHELTAQGISVQALHRQPGFHPQLGKAIARLAARHGAGIVHCHHYSPFVYGCVARLLKPGLRVVFTEHGRLSDARPSPRRRLANHVLARVPAAAFAVSSELREHLIDEGFPPLRMSVIYNGIEPGPVPQPSMRQKIRERLRVSDGTIVVGTIARLDPVKDLGTTIRAVRQLASEPSTVLCIVGDGAERSSLEALAHGLGLDDRVRFLGQRNDARDWLAGWDVYVNSSISEGISLTILEAMAASLPVVVTRVGGNPEVVDEGCGVVVPARSPDALSEAIRGLAGDAGRRATLGAAGRLRVEQRFSLSRMIREYRDVYERLA